MGKPRIAGSGQAQSQGPKKRDAFWSAEDDCKLKLKFIKRERVEQLLLLAQGPPRGQEGLDC